MADNTENMFLSILDNGSDDIKSICELSDSARAFSQALVLDTMLREISTTLAPYFKLVGDLLNEGTGPARVLGSGTKRDGTDANLERMVAAGLHYARKTNATKQTYIDASDTERLYETTKSLAISFKEGGGGFVTGTNLAPKYEFADGTQVANIFVQLRALATSGAKLLEIDKQAIDELSSGDKTNRAFGEFLRTRFNNIVEDTKQKVNANSNQQRVILAEMLISLGTGPGAALRELARFEGAPEINRLNIPMSTIFKGKISAPAGLIYLLRDQSGTPIAKRIKVTTSSFLKALYDSEEAMAFSGDLNNRQKFKERFKEYLKRRCKQGETEDLGKINKKTGTTHDKRLQNLKCILPLFEDAYSIKGSSPSALENTSNLAPFGVKEIAFDLASSSKSILDPGVKINHNHFKADQFPLIFPNTNNSHFFVNRLFNQDPTGKQLKSFMEITNTDVSKLVPKIRIYKIKYDNNRNEVEIPIEFSNRTELNPTKPGYWRENAGIKKVSFTRTGQNPATVKRYLTCKLSLYFDSINSFLKKRMASNGKEFAYVDFLRRSSEYNPIKGAELKNNQAYKNIQQSIASENFLTKEESITEIENKFNELALSDYNDDYFQIKINVGWAVNPELYGNTPQSAKMMQELNKFIHATNLTLYLTLMTHDFTFGNDGTLSLDLTYMGRLQQKIRGIDANIFSEHALDRKIKSASVIGQVIAALKGDMGSDKTSKEVKNLGRLKAKLLAQIEAGKDDLRGQLWEVLTNEDGKMVKLKGSTVEDGYIPTHILKATIDEEYLGSGKHVLKSLSKTLRKELRELGLEKRGVVLNPGEMIHHAYTRLLTDEKASTGLAIKQIFRKGKNYRDGIRGHEPNAGAQTQKALEKQKKEEAKKGRKVLFHKNDKFSFYVIRFGSVIQAAMQNLWNNNPQALESIGAILGPIKFKGLDGKDRLTNICHIPILLEDWKAFMARHVVAEDATVYNLLHYIRDAVSELLIPALGHTCKDSTERLISPLKNVKIKAITASALRNPEFKVQPQKDNSAYKKFQLNIDKKFSGNNAKKPIFSRKMVGNTTVVSPTKGDLKHYIIIYDAGSSAVPSYIGSDKLLYDKNLANNIPHFFIGANKGILKTIGFRKTEVPFLQEHRVIDNGDTDFGLLREKYDCTLSVVGNPHFTQGMKLYVDPTLTGFSNPSYKDIVQRDLGLGGYYDIVGVTSTVDSKSFDTEIQASWVSFAPKKTK